MNFEFAEKINPDLENLNFCKALHIAETELKKLATTDFHDVLGNTFTNHVDNLARWINKFHLSISKKFEVKALYFEMIEFDINTTVWCIDGFAFPKDGGLDQLDMEWLCDVTRETMTRKEFILTGYEKLQNAFENIELANDNLQDARDWCEQIIIIRFMELMRMAHLKAKQRNFEWANIPIYFTEHSYSFIVRSE